MQELDWVPVTFEGQEGYRLDFMCFVPMGDPRAVGPQAGAATIIAMPPQGRAGFTAMAVGPPGQPPAWRHITPIAVPHDQSSLSGDADLAVPGDEDTPAQWDLSFEVPRGQPGDPGDMDFEDLNDVYGTAAEGYVPTWSATAGGADTPGLVYTSAGHGGLYWPSSISNTTAANGQLRTVTSVQIPVQPFDWRPRVDAGCIISGTVNTRPHLLARVGDASSGDIVGRAFTVPGVAVQNPPWMSGVPAGSDADHGVIAAGDGPTIIYLRAEEQASTVDNYTTTGSTTWFNVKVEKVV
ncbi:hypothetical protein AB4Z39_10810 [Mycobacterium adipatum]|uniref:hypothetical protein n=1 Tax=Mycobacterium adipatum TaxID=1682113 RepID=UPI0034E0D793